MTSKWTIDDFILAGVRSVVIIGISVLTYFALLWGDSHAKSKKASQPDYVYTVQTEFGIFEGLTKDPYSGSYSKDGKQYHFKGSYVVTRQERAENEQ